LLWKTSMPSSRSVRTDLIAVLNSLKRAIMEKWGGTRDARIARDSSNETAELIAVFKNSS
jgi:hypothetical protein